MTWQPDDDWLEAHAETFTPEPQGCTHLPGDPWCDCPDEDDIGGVVIW